MEHASVPDAVVRPDEQVWVYFVNGQPGQHGTWVARPTSSGLWEVIGCVRLDGVFNGNAVDPDIVRLPDGRYRLFYYEGFFVGPRPPPGQEPPHPILSAVSVDGLNFTVEGQLLAAEGVTDPSAVQLPDGSWLMALAQGTRTVLAASGDGRRFTLTSFALDAGGIPELVLLPDGRIRLFISRPSGFQSLISADAGRTWTAEPGTRLAIQGGITADPSLLRMPNGTWQMFFKVAPAGATPAAPATATVPPAATPPASPRAPAPSPAAAPTIARVAGANPQWITIGARENKTIQAAVAWPDGPGPFPVVVLLHGTVGFSQSMVQIAQDFARNGFIALAGCWFEGSHNPNATIPDLIPCSNGPTYKGVSPPATLDARALVDAAKRLEGARAGGVRLWGHSRGASMALVLASTDTDIQAVVAVSASYTQFTVGSRELLPITLASDLHAPVLMLHGTADTTVPVTQAQEYEATLRRVNKTYEAYYYVGAPHTLAFITPTQEDALRRAVAFFQGHPPQ